MYSINCKGRLIQLDRAKVMGILNITPNSFYDGGKYNNPAAILNQTEKMLNEGATFIDVGAISSRPGANLIPENAELNLIVPVVELLLKEFPEILLSIDTFRSSIAEHCVASGACIINDISAGSIDHNMFNSIAKLQVPYIIMHMQGVPQNMQIDPIYDDVVKDILFYFSKKIEALRALGVHDIITDVGFGFGKTIEDNYQLLNHLELFKNLAVPSLAGLSRKSMLYKPLDIGPELALNSTTSANTIALIKGVNILRVHDVKEAVEAIKIVELSSVER